GGDMWQPATIDSAATRTASLTRVVDRVVARGSPRRGEPAAREAGSLDAAAHIRALACDTPDHGASVVLDHGEDRALIDAEVVPVHPAEARHAPAMSQWDIEGP